MGEILNFFIGPNYWVRGSGFVTSQVVRLFVMIFANDLGWLTIDWTRALGHACILTIGPWSERLVVSSIHSDDPMKLTLSDLGEWLFDTEDNAVQSWRTTIPPDVLTSLMTLPNRRGLILEAVVDDKPLRDLLTSNSLLLWFLLDKKILKIPGPSATLLSQKQKELANNLGLEGTQQQVRLIRKASCTSLGKGAAHSFFDLLNSPEICDYFSHQFEIRKEVIDLLQGNPWLVNCTARELIPDLIKLPNRRLFDDVLRMSIDIDPLMSCRTIGALQRLHDRLVAELNEKDTKILVRDVFGKLVPFVDPPLEGNDKIFPIADQLELLREGKEMRHCISSYLNSVISGEYFVYQMLEPQRLTIGIVITAWGQCFLREVRGKSNSAPTKEAMDAVQDWFSSNEPATNDGLPKYRSPRGVNEQL